MGDFLSQLEPYKAYLGGFFGLVGLLIAILVYGQKQRKKGEKAFSDRVEKEQKKKVAEFLKEEVEKAYEIKDMADSIPNVWSRVVNKLLSDKASANVRSTTDNIDNRKLSADQPEIPDSNKKT